MIRWFIGYDPREAVTLHVLAHSLMRHSSMPISVTPVALCNLDGILTRERHPHQTNDFSFSRFLVPWMCNYEGWSVFSDCDMVVKDDPAKLWALRDEKFAVKVVHHNHIPQEETKYLGQRQTKYERKNWSSVILFNNAKCKVLTPEYVNTTDGLDLHQFKWLTDEEIGYLPKVWNHLVGHDKPNPEAKNIHYTIGGPYFKEYSTCEHHQSWWHEHSLMTYVKQVDK